MKPITLGGRRVRHRLAGWLGTAISTSHDGRWVVVKMSNGHTARCRSDNLQRATRKAIEETDGERRARQAASRRKRKIEQSIAQFMKNLAT